MAEVETPFHRTCAWTGEETPGKHYVLKTTEGEELVSEAAFRAAPADTAAQLDHLTATVNRLTRRVAELEGAGAKGGAAPARRPGRPRKTAAPVPAQASTKD
jgi:hypothetical protein